MEKTSYVLNFVRKSLWNLTLLEILYMNVFSNNQKPIFSVFVCVSLWNLAISKRLHIPQQLKEKKITVLWMEKKKCPEWKFKSAHNFWPSPSIHLQWGQANIVLDILQQVLHSVSYGSMYCSSNSSSTWQGFTTEVHPLSVHRRQTKLHFVTRLIVLTVQMMTWILKHLAPSLPLLPKATEKASNVEDYFSLR